MEWIGGWWWVCVSEKALNTRIKQGWQDGKMTSTTWKNNY